jgi:putative endonuclease
MDIKQGVYILENQKNFKFYIGSTSNLDRRLNEHDQGLVKATRNIRLLELVFFQKFNEIKKARQIEYKLKKFKNRKIIEEIIKEGIIKMGR